MATIDLTGAADLHCHFGPDAHRERSVDALDAARDVAAARHAAVVLKSHDYPIAALAAVVDRVVDGVRVFGGICCDREVGGVNPAAVGTQPRGRPVHRAGGSRSHDRTVRAHMSRRARDTDPGRDRTRREHDRRRPVHPGHRLRAKANVRPASGFQEFADALLADGLDESAIRRMACDNPCALLGLGADPAA
jgi:hypothetical protein